MSTKAAFWFIIFASLIVALTGCNSRVKSEVETQSQSSTTASSPSQATPGHSYGFSLENLETLSNTTVALPIPNTNQVILITGDQIAEGNKLRELPATDQLFGAELAAYDPKAFVALVRTDQGKSYIFAVGSRLKTQDPMPIIGQGYATLTGDSAQVHFQSLMQPAEPYTITVTMVDNSLNKLGTHVVKVEGAGNTDTEFSVLQGTTGLLFSFDLL
ncbi:MAG: hypothetical protein OHK0017_02650 [Patescibacteria group bacterium]